MNKCFVDPAVKAYSTNNGQGGIPLLQNRQQFRDLQLSATTVRVNAARLKRFDSGPGTSCM